MSIRKIRQLKGYSQTDAAKLLGIPLRTYKRYELSEETKRTYKHEMIENKIKTLTNNVIRKKIKKETIAVIGAGNVGYPLGLLLSELNSVVFIDSNKDKINRINDGVCISTEKDTIEYFKTKSPKVRGYTDKKYLNICDSIIICLPTNYKEEINALDTSLIEEYTSYIFDNNPTATVVIKSTVPIGFCEQLLSKYENMEIIFSPEFLREEHSLYDSQYPSRLIFGVNRITLKNRRMAMVLENVTLNATKTVFMSYKEAESVKLFSNSYLAMRIAYMNEIDTFAMENNLDVSKIINSVCADPRIGNFYNNPSFGYGGHCFPKDTKQLSSSLENSVLVNAIVESNDQREQIVADEIISKLKDRNSVIGFYNYANKNSSSIEVANIIKNRGYVVIFYDSDLNSKLELENFIKKSDLIVANRLDEEIYAYKEKVFSRDLFQY